MAGITGRMPEIDPPGGDPALDDLLVNVRACRICESALPLGPRPVVRMAAGAKILVIGQAPGTKVHETGVPWNDASGDRLPDVGLTLLIGQYAQERYLGPRRAKNMTETVRLFPEYLPDGLLPMPHPSWRNTGWIKKNSWFESDLLPVLRERVHYLLQ